MIRNATAADIPRLVEMAHAMHLEGRFASRPFDAERVAAIGHGLIQSGGCLIVYERDGRVLGVVAGGLAESFFNHDRQACTLIVYVDPVARGGWAVAALIRAFERWSAQAGAFEAMVGVGNGRDWERVGKLYERLGFTCCGGQFFMALN